MPGTGCSDPRTEPVPVALMRRVAVVLDLVAVLVFVGIGRSVHAHGLGIGGLASTAWPFVSGLAVGWVALTLAHRDPASLRSGVLVCAATVAVGMALRVVAGQGTAAAFVVVALCFLGAFMCSWRLLARLFVA
jgi:pimeloyl-ACP methyl ester carboxylesterase